MFIHLFIIYLFIHSFIRSFVRSFVRSYVRSFVRSFVHLFIYLFIYLSITHIYTERFHRRGCSGDHFGARGAGLLLVHHPVDQRQYPHQEGQEHDQLLPVPRALLHGAVAPHPRLRGGGGRHALHHEPLRPDPAWRRAEVRPQGKHLVLAECPAAGNQGLI